MLKFMGAWGYKPHENDAAANWFDELFDLTGLAQHVEETLNRRVGEFHEEVRAAASIVLAHGENYIWPHNSRERVHRLAARRLRELLDGRLYTEDDFVRIIKGEIDQLEARIARPSA